MNIKHTAIAAVIAATFIVTITVATNSALAIENNQSTSQDHDCGNEIESVNVRCQTTVSQMEGDHNVVSQKSEQPFEELEESGAALTGQQQDLAKENTPASTSQQSITPSIVLPH